MRYYYGCARSGGIILYCYYIKLRCNSNNIKYVTHNVDGTYAVNLIRRDFPYDVIRSDVLAHVCALVFAQNMADGSEASICDGINIREIIFTERDIITLQYNNISNVKIL